MSRGRNPTALRGRERERERDEQVDKETTTATVGGGATMMTWGWFGSCFRVFLVCPLHLNI
jgi:hypothetical protein